MKVDSWPLKANHKTVFYTIHKMQISYAIVAHNNPEQLGRLIDKLQSPDVSFFVHIDSKADIDSFKHQTSTHKNIFFIEKRWDVKWGDYSVVGAYIECLRVICEKTPGSFILHLSGQDYPVKSNEYIKEFISDHKNSIFLKHFELPLQSWKGNGGLDRVFSWHYHLGGRNVISFKPMDITHNNIRNIAWLLLGKPVLFPKLAVRFFCKRKYPLPYTTHYGGEFWMSMSQKTAGKILDTMKRNSRIEQYYRHCGNPDEIMLQTLILNQNDLRSNVENNCLKYIDWSGRRGQSPLTFTMEDRAEIQQAIENPSLLFARKFDINADSSILDYIDNVLAGR